MLTFGASMAQCAPIIAGPGGPRLTETPAPVADVKAGINAGGLAGADVNASVGAGGAGIGVSGAVNEKGAEVSAGVDAGLDAGAGGAKVDADVESSATAKAGGAKVGAGVNAGADTATGAVNGSAGVGAEAGGAKVGAGVNADADAATGAVNGRAGVSADAGGAKVGAGAGVADDGEANGTIGARAAVAATAPAQGTSSILLPILPLQGQQGDDAGSIGVRKTQLAMLGCIDPLFDGTCPTEPQAIPQSRTRFEIVDETDGAANVATSTVVQPTQGAGPTYPQPRVSQSFGIALADPVRTKSGLVVRCIIVNISNRNQPIPRLDVRLLNSAGEVVAHSVLSAPSDALAGGQEKTFEVRIRSLPPHAKHLAVSLVSPN
jgi:hypothetical protein